MPARKHLYLVVHNPSLHTGTFTQVAEGVERCAPHIRARVVRDKRARLRRWGRILRPSLTVSMCPLTRYRPVRGAVVTGRGMGKDEQLRRFRAEGIPVPRWEVLAPDRAFDPTGWGRYVVVKPNRGQRGAGVKIKKSTRVRPTAASAELGERLVQEFIYTGPYPEAYRVSTLFGRVLYCLRTTARDAKMRIEGPEDFNRGGVSIVASRDGCTYELADDAEVVEFGRRAAAAIRDVPLLGLDIVREQETGRLFVLEANPAGWTWLFSSEAGRRLQSQFGFEVDDQMDGLAVASRALAEETDARAR